LFFLLGAVAKNSPAGATENAASMQSLVLPIEPLVIHRVTSQVHAVNDAS
jgi:hypothetical protein